MLKTIVKPVLSKIQRMRDVIRRRLAIFIFDRKNDNSLERVISKDKARLLVYRLDAKWGDSIISSFFYREINKIDNMEVIVVSTPELYSLYKNEYKANDVYILKKRPSYRELYKVAKHIGKVDVVVHLTESIKMKEMFLLYLLSPRIVFSLDDEPSIVSHKLGAQTKDIPFREKYRTVLSELKVPDVNMDYIIPLHNTKIEGYDILVNAFGSTDNKSISIENGKSIIKMLSVEFPHKRIGIMSSPHTYDKAMEMLDGDISGAEIVGGINSFYDAVEVINNSDLIITVDTALVHVADGLGKKLVAVFPKNNDEFNPWLPTDKFSNKVVFSYAEGVDVNLNNYSKAELLDKVRSIYKK